jgi:hypothetical protein
LGSREHFLILQGKSSVELQMVAGLAHFAGAAEGGVWRRALAENGNTWSLSRSNDPCADVKLRPSATSVRRPSGRKPA